MEDVPLSKNDDVLDSSDADSKDTSSGLSLRVLSQILTVAIAVAAIGLSIWEGTETRRHNRLSVLYCSCSVYGDHCATTSFWNRDVPKDFECRPFVTVGE